MRSRQWKAKMFVVAAGTAHMPQVYGTRQHGYTATGVSHNGSAVAAGAAKAAARCSHYHRIQVAWEKI